ncbi:MAG: DJ-1/PfpI family protein, partial [Candidatus Aenigmarchaeota archaeon]|nr:DJ-1/PfpI family protein [Candidatus Aenigmarchaeota archaeon]
MKKRVLIPLANGFEETEAIATADVLRRANIEVVLAGIPGQIVEGAHGIKIISDKKIEDARKEEFDAVVLPGGNPGCKNLSNCKNVIEILKDFNEKKKTIAAICASPSILSKIGILDGKRATIFPGMERDIPMPRDSKVIVDGHVITSQGPGTAVDFALAIVTQLDSKFRADDV